MVLISLFLFLSVKFFAGIGASQDDCQILSSCSEQGPLVQFPFRLKDQPHSCGYPGFELACVQKKQTMLTMLELPNSVKLMVKKINYKSQEIVVQDPDHCLSRQLLNFNPNASLFRFKLENNFPQKHKEVVQDFTIFNCSSPKEESDYFQPIRCAVGNSVYAVPSSSHLYSLDLFSCHGIYRAYISRMKYLLGKVILRWVGKNLYVKTVRHKASYADWSPKPRNLEQNASQKMVLYSFLILLLFTLQANIYLVQLIPDDIIRLPAFMWWLQANGEFTLC